MGGSLPPGLMGIVDVYSKKKTVDYIGNILGNLQELDMQPVKAPIFEQLPCSSPPIVFYQINRSSADRGIALL